MRRPLAVALAFLLLGVAVAVYSPQPALGQSEDPFKTISMYWYGVVDQDNDGDLIPEAPTSEDDTRSECPQGSNTNMGGAQEVGSWRSIQAEYEMVVQGEIYFEFWAQADEGDGVDGVEFTLSIFGQEYTTDAKGVAEEPVLFSGNITLDNPITISEGWRISFTLDYNGNDDYNPLQNDQVYVISSSIDHPSRIEFEGMDHVEAEFNVLTFDIENERVLFNTTIGSGFGSSAIQNNSWDLEVRGEQTNFEASTFCEDPIFQEVSEGFEVQFCWYYNADSTPTDLFFAAINFEDIQGHRYHLESEESFPLIYTHNLNLNNRISADGIMVNGKPFIDKVIVDETVTISAKIEAVGDEAASNNPVEYLFYVQKSGNATEKLIKRDVIIDLPIGESETVEVTWKPTSTGTYTIRIELDKSEYTKETNELDNGADLVLKVVDEEETWLESFQNRLEEDNLALALVIVMIVGIVAIIAVVIVIGRGGGRRRRDRGADEWDDDF